MNERCIEIKSVAGNLTSDPMEAIDELVQLSESMRQASALLADEDVEESRRTSTFLNVVGLGNVVSSFYLIHILVIAKCICSESNE